MTLKRDLTCPNCEGREIWRIETMHERGRSSAHPQPIGIMLEARMFGDADARGKFETLICNGCGYTEWYAKEIGFLKNDPVNGIHFIKNDVEKEGPYR
ncbi:MAG: hypothetical protein ACXVAN_11210 [Polyangia bacterium]|jgi:hypothetical protein